MTCTHCNAPLIPGQPACAACGQLARPGAGIEAGSLVAGRYEVQAVLGRGGMGVVYRAHDRLLDETVALKVLRAEAVSGEMGLRFRDEIRLARRVSHRNVCRIHEYGEDGALRYISMAFVDGVDLKRVLRDGGPLPPAQAYHATLAIADGLQAVHDEGIVHRDLKTPNIMRDNRGVIRLMDFGIAKDGHAATSAGLTATGLIVGTPEYMSPEQAMGAKVDARCDLYALGIVAYELFTGRVPFRADTPMAVILQHIRDAPPLDLPEIPAALREVLDRALAKEPGDRYTSARSMADELRAAAAAPEATVIQRRPAPRAAAVMAPPRPATRLPTRVLPPRPRRAPVLLVLAGVLVLVAAAAGGVQVALGRRGAPSAPPAGAVAGPPIVTPPTAAPSAAPRVLPYPTPLPVPTAAPTPVRTPDLRIAPPPAALPSATPSPGPSPSPAAAPAAALPPSPLPVPPTSPSVAPPPIEHGAPERASAALMAPPDRGSLGRLRRAIYVAGTLGGFREGTAGDISLAEKGRLLFLAREGSAFAPIPYDGITGLEYGQTARMRTAAVILTPLALFSKKKSHYVTVHYHDAYGERQAAVFELGKDDFRPVLALLEARSGTAVVYQDEKAAADRWK